MPPKKLTLPVVMEEYDVSRACDFLHWLFLKLKVLKIPFKNYKTDGDYYRVKIGNAEVQRFDWKHLDILEIQKCSEALRPFGWQIFITHHPKQSPHEFRVQLRGGVDGVYYVYRHEPSSTKHWAIQQWQELEGAIFNRRLTSSNIDKLTLINALLDYMNDLKVSNKTFHRNLFNEITSAPELKRITVTDFQPGTGQATRQFYKFANAIYKEIDLQKIPTEKLLLVIGTKVFDGLE
jgi:hypothetical protein